MNTTRNASSRDRHIRTPGETTSDSSPSGAAPNAGRRRRRDDPPAKLAASGVPVQPTTSRPRVLQNETSTGALREREGRGIT